MESDGTRRVCQARLGGLGWQPRVSGHQARGFRDFDTSMVVRLVAGLAMSQCLFADLMYFGSDTPLPTSEAVVREMAMLTITAPVGAADPLDPLDRDELSAARWSLPV